MIESCVVRINVMGQTPDAQLNEIKAAAQEEYKRLNAFLLGIPDVIAAPLGCHGQAGVDEKQVCTIRTFLLLALSGPSVRRACLIGQNRFQS
jgi:hypothetical protein